MPGKFFSDLRFHEVLQTSIIRLITKGKNRKIQSKSLEMCTNLYVCVCVCGVIVAYYCEYVLVEFGVCVCV